MNISFGTGQQVFFFLLLAVVTIFFLWMVHGFLFSVFWAIVFAVLLHPVYHALRKRVGNDTFAAILVMLGAFLLVVVPVSWLGAEVAQQAFSFYRAASESGVLASLALPQTLLDPLSLLGISVGELQTYVASGVQIASAWVVSEALTIGSATFSVILNTFLMLYFLFFFLRDGEALGHYIMRRLPLGDRKERALFERFASTTRAVVKGTVVSGIAQGFVGGILLAVAGVENAILWGVVMAFLSIIPAVGPSLVWIPIGLYLLATGFLVPALIILVGGIVLVSPIDNLLKPILVGREVSMPDALILVSILGGIGAFGVAGVIVGPVVAALLLAVWNIFAEEYEVELSRQG